MNYRNSNKTVLTLDAGGTNFVFSAIRSYQEIVTPLTLPSNADNLHKCLDTIIHGFSEIGRQAGSDPSAISFAFPGPADYPNGIIGDLGNLPCFRGGVALGPMLEEKFGIPVFINNDGDLFAYGEAIAGFLPYVNGILEKGGSKKRFSNLLGVTLGTGFGAGIVRNNELYVGDNSCAAEIWLVRGKFTPTMNAEEGACIRALQRFYGENGNDSTIRTPREISDIASGIIPGDRHAALEAYRLLGESVGDALANAVTLIDGLVVIGGGISASYHLFMPSLIAAMNSHFDSPSGRPVPRLASRVFNLQDNDESAAFVRGSQRTIQVPFSSTEAEYDDMKRIGVGVSLLGTSRAVSIGAYAFALSRIGR